MGGYSHLTASDISKPSCIMLDFMGRCDRLDLMPAGQLPGSLGRLTALILQPSPKKTQSRCSAPRAVDNREGIYEGS